MLILTALNFCMTSRVILSMGYAVKAKKRFCISRSYDWLF